MLAALLGRILTLPPIANRSERGIYAASLSASPQANRFVRAARTLKRPEGRAPRGQCADAPALLLFMHSPGRNKLFHTALICGESWRCSVGM